MSAGRGFTAELVAVHDDPAIGDERIRVTFDDGEVRELRLHDYAELYALPGVYEQIVQDRLACASPQRLAAMLAAAADGLSWARNGVRVFDLAAGNGVSGEALAAEGLVPVLGSDIVPQARDAALRDRPGLYGDYLTLDLLALTAPQRATVAAAQANALSCVAPVGDHPSQLPPAALTAAAQLLAPDALVVYMHDPALGVPDPVTEQLWSRSGTSHADQLARVRYVHRHTVNGEPYAMEGVVWRLRRDG
ncbi:MAG: hypothetical protein WBQ18_05850 [Solirubrobacteraceae bacterium]